MWVQVDEIFAFINGVVYRSTMYQYVYPTMGLMTECQYDLCKRDFALDQVESWAKLHAGPFFFGDSPTIADLVWASLWLGNNWVQVTHVASHAVALARHARPHPYPRPRPRPLPG